jgi:uncharacterized protein YecT (DUF1311 family)
MNKATLCLLILMLLFVPIVSYSASNGPIKAPKKVKSNPHQETHKSEIEINIDKTENECMENNPTQGGINNCAGKSLEAWDKALNEIYGKLMKRLNEKAKISLRDSQREWIKYRDSHFKFLEAYYEKFEGSMYVGMLIKDEIAIVRERVLILLSLLDIVRLELDKP